VGDRTGPSMLYSLLGTLDDDGAVLQVDTSAVSASEILHPVKARVEQKVRTSRSSSTSSACSFNAFLCRVSYLIYRLKRPRLISIDSFTSFMVGVFTTPIRFTSRR
jgi:hypothetical protein